MRRKRLGSLRIIFVEAASILLLSACAAEDKGTGRSNSVDPSSLYQDSSESQKQAPANGDLSDLPPVLSKDDSIPHGQTGEIVPTVGALLGEMTPQQKLVLNTAYYLVVKKCMRDQGFTLFDPPPKLETSDSGPILFDGYIGILDVDYAKKYGYQLYIDDAGNQGQKRVSGDPKYEDALKVAGNGGCAGEADRMIEKDVPGEDTSTPLLSTIYQDSLNQRTWIRPTRRHLPCGRHA